MVYEYLNFDHSEKFHFLRKNKISSIGFFLTRFDATFGVVPTNCLVFNGVRPTNVPVDVACAA